MRLYGTWESDGYLSYKYTFNEEEVSFKIKCRYTIGNKSMIIFEEVIDSSNEKLLPNGVQRNDEIRFREEIDDKRIYLLADSLSYEYKFQGNNLYLSILKGLFFGPLYKK